MAKTLEEALDELPLALLTEYLSRNIRLRFESAKKRFDMRDVVHLEMKLPIRDSKGQLTGESTWTSISVADMREI